MKTIPWACLAITAMSVPLTAQIDPQIAHVAQGHGWSTVIRAMNICNENAQFWIDFYGENGQPLGVVLEGRRTQPKTRRNSLRASPRGDSEIHHGQHRQRAHSGIRRGHRQ